MSWTRPDYNHPRPKYSDLRSIRALGTREVVIYCGNPGECSHQVRVNADRWPDDAIFGELERRIVCSGSPGADMRPVWNNWRLAS